MTTQAETLRTAVEDEANRYQNSGTSYDSNFDKTLEAVIQQAVKLLDKPDGLTKAEAKLAAVIEKGAYGYDQLTDAQAGRIDASFDGWRAAVKFLGGTLAKDVEAAEVVEDLADWAINS